MPARRSGLSRQPPIFDAEHLDRQTMGDEAFRVEILALFLAEIERLLGQVEAAGGAAKRCERLHAVTGLARNVGAVRLGNVARDLERQAARAPHSPVDLDPLRAAVREVVALIRSGA